jgi:hypothetical protein
MKPLFTIHEGEFLVGDHINRQLGHKFDVWVPTKDSGVDLLVTRKRLRGKAVGLQVKFSRGFNIREDMARHLIATSWFTLDPVKVRKSQADLWVFVILTLKHEEHFVVIPTRELRKRMPRGSDGKWNLYLWVFDDRSCYQVRDLGREETLDILHRGVRDRHRDFSQWLENWKLLDSLTGKAQ